MPIFFVRLPELLEQSVVGKTTLYARIKQEPFRRPSNLESAFLPGLNTRWIPLSMLICDQQQKRIFRSWSLSS